MKVTTWHRLQIVSGQLVRPRRQQEEDRVGRRLLQDLQQRVGGGRRQSVGFAHHEDLAARFRRGPIGGLPDLVADRVDVDVAPLRLDHELVRVLIAKRERQSRHSPHPPFVHSSEATKARAAIDFPRALGPGEDVGVVRTFGRAAQERHRDVLPGT